MDPKFQSSFIPKKPLPSTGAPGASIGLPNKVKPVHTVSIFLNISILIFVISLGAAGVAYAWKTVLLSRQDAYKQELNELEKRFNPDLIRQLQQINQRIDNVKLVLGRHVALSNIFDVISKMTAENTRFLSMDAVTSQGRESGVSGADTSNNIKIMLSGYGANLSAVAFQAKVLSQLDKYGLGSVLINPTISEPSIDQNGTVSFSISEEIDPSRFIYMAGNSATVDQNQTNNQAAPANEVPPEAPLPEQQNQ